MRVAAITLLLSMAGASALGIKPAKARAVADAARRMQDSLQKVKVSFDTVMQSRRLDAHDSGGLDMGGMMKPECSEACPGVTDLLKTFMEMATQATTTPEPGKEGEAMMAMMQEILCPHMDTMDCMSKTDKCKSTTRRLDAHDKEGDMDMMGMIGCMCVCPDLMAMSSGRRLDAHGDSDDGDASMKAMCANPTGTIGCMTQKSECQVMEDMMKKSMPGMDGDMMAYLGVACDWASNECDGKMESCDGGEAADAEFESKACGKPETTDKSPCCASVQKMKECQGETCMKLSFVMMSMSPEAESAAMYDEALKVSKACPEVGMPTSKAEVTAVMTASKNKMTGEDASTGDAAAGGAFHTIPAFGMVATVLAFAAVGNI